MTLIKAFFAIIAVLFAHALAIVFHLYGLWHWLDIPMHFAGGLAMGLLALALWQEGIVEVRFKGWLAKHLEWWLVPLFIFGFVALVGVAWEIYEYVMDNYFTAVIDGVYQIVRQPSLADTMFDLVMDLLGATVVAAYSLIKK